MSGIKDGDMMSTLLNNNNNNNNNNKARAKNKSNFLSHPTNPI